MNLLDLVIILLVVVSAVAGFRRGAVLQVLGYGGLILGLLLGALVAPAVARLADDTFIQAILALATLLVGAAIGDVLGWFLGHRAWLVARRSVLDPVDSAGGAVVAATAALLAAWFLAFNLVQGPFPLLAREIRQSSVVRGLDTVLPRPPSLLAEARRFLSRAGFPEVFADLPPVPAGPVDLPSRGEVREAFEAADQSTVKVVGQACDRILEGSGFVIEPGYVVTNAHVIAGVDRPEIQEADGSSYGSVAVLFDPGLDLAVLRVDSSATPDLDLAGDALDRGARGAVLGFPGGGPLTGSPAGVRRSMTALGRDIYGRRTVEREVYELQVVVRPGNSGGPFVTPQGDVAGVVFAASSTDRDVGYALTSDQVEPGIRRALGRTEPVGTGRCIR